MASKLVSEDVYQLSCPPNTANCAIDMGGSLLKVAYVPADQKQQDKTTGTVIHLAVFKPADITSALQYVQENARPPAEGAIMVTTGIGIRGHAKQLIEETLGVKLNNIPETFPMVSAFIDLIKREPEERSMLSPSRGVAQQADLLAEQVKTLMAQWKRAEAEQTEESDETGVTLEQDDGETNGSKKQSSGEAMREELKSFFATNSHLFPILISSLGTGCNFVKVNEDGTCDGLGGNNRAGKTLLGLSSLLLGTSDFDAIMALAEKGDPSVLSNYMRDLKSNTDGDVYAMFPDDLRMFSFGKAIGKSVDSVSKEDMARALLCHMSDDLAQTYYWVARANQCKAVFVNGSFGGHPLVRDMLYHSFSVMGETMGPDPVKIFFLQHGAYLPVVGCLMAQ